MSTLFLLRRASALSLSLRANKTSLLGNGLHTLQGTGQGSLVSTVQRAMQMVGEKGSGVLGRLLTGGLFSTLGAVTVRGVVEDTRDHGVRGIRAVENGVRQEFERVELELRPNSEQNSWSGFFLFFSLFFL